MIFKVGDQVEICAQKGSAWFSGVVTEQTSTGYKVSIDAKPTASVWLGIKRTGWKNGRVESVFIPSHLETIGVSWQCIRMKRNKK